MKSQNISNEQLTMNSEQYCFRLISVNNKVSICKCKYTENTMKYRFQSL